MSRNYQPFGRLSDDGSDVSANPKLVQALRNGLLDRAGRIVRTPAWTDAGILAENTAHLAQGSKGLAIGSDERGQSALLFESIGGQGAGDYPAYPLRMAASGSASGVSSWAIDNAPNHALVPVTNPRTTVVRTVTGYSMISSSLLEIYGDSSTFVLVAEYYGGVSFSLVSIVSGTPVRVRDIDGPTSTAGFDHPRVAGRFFLWMDGTDIKIATYSTTGGWSLKITIAVGATAQHFGACYVATMSKIFIVDYYGRTCAVDTITWAATALTARVGSGGYGGHLPRNGKYTIAACPAALDPTHAYIWLGLIAATGSNYYYYLDTWEYYSGVWTWRSEVSLGQTGSTQHPLRLTAAALSDGPFNLGHRCWVQGQVVTDATDPSIGSAMIALMYNFHLAWPYTDTILRDYYHCSEMLDERIGAWFVVASQRKYLRQKWLIFIDKTEENQYLTSDILMVLRAASRMSLGLTPTATNEIDRELAIGSLKHVSLGSRDALMWSGTELLSGDFSDSASFASGEPGCSACISTAEYVKCAGIDAGWDSPDTTWPPDLFDSAIIDGKLTFSCGVPVSLDGGIASTGIHEQPKEPAAANLATGTALPAGDYYYVIAYQYTDSRGNIHYGPVSEATMLTADGHDAQLTIQGSLSWPGSSQISVHVYRTEKGGATYYEVTRGTGIPWVSAQSAPVTYTDSVTDADLITRPLLYTQRSRDEVCICY